MRDRDRSDVPEVFLGNDLIGREELLSVQEVIDSQSIFRYYGPNMLHRTDQFEEQLRKYFNVKKALCVSSGTAALKVAIQSLNLQVGDEIILPSFGYIATANAIISCNAVPVFADIDKSMNIDPKSVEKLINSKTKAVICIHISGQSCAIEELACLCHMNNISLIEDVAQSFGGTYKGRFLGTIGNMGCFSFQSNKILSTGEGGCFITEDEKLYVTARNYHDQGGERVNNGYPKWNNNNCLFGENLRMNEITATLGLEQLKKIEMIIGKTKKQKKEIIKRLSNLNLDWRINYDEKGDCSISICFFIEDYEVRNQILQELKFIHANGYYNSAMYENYVFENISRKYKLTSVKELGITKEKMNLNKCQNAEKFSNQAIWIPLSPLYTDQNVETIIASVEKAVNKFAGV